MSDEVKPLSKEELGQIGHWLLVHPLTKEQWERLLATLAERDVQIAALKRKMGEMFSLPSSIFTSRPDPFERMRLSKAAHESKFGHEEIKLMNALFSSQHAAESRATSAEATCARLREERNAMLERMFDLCRQGRVASECVDTSHGVGWNACITWMDSALCAVRSSMTQADGERG